VENLDIKEIVNKEKEDEIYSLSCDILRALVILYGSAWHSELLFTLNELWSLKGIDLDKRIEKEKMLDKALKLLSSKGIVNYEKRKRAYLERTEALEENFYFVKRITSLIKFFAGDEIISKYRRASMGY